ncbi:hypothetical protein ACOSP7_021596 [Xanthoceras sorbifolium]
MVIYNKHLSGGLLLWVSLGILFCLFSSTKAEKWEPRKYVNLSPFREWRSAYECILNETNPCQAKYKLNMTGVVDVPQEEVAEYCGAGCAEHVKVVLQCIHDVKRDFWFGNKAPVKFINESITTGCSTTTRINTTSYTNSANSMKNYKILSVPLMLVLFMIIFNI